jgi:hypothetical protein
MSSDIKDLKAELEALAAEGAQHIRRDRGRRARPFALVGGLGLTSRMGLVAAALVFTARVMGAPVPAWPLAIGIVLACTSMGWLVLSRARLLPVARADALALWDRAAGLEDRLLAADEFLARPPAGDGDFAAAAIEDAAEQVARARQGSWSSEPPAVSLGGHVAWAVGALVLLLAVDLVPYGRVELPPEADELVTVALPVAASPVADEEPAPSSPPEVPEPPPRARERPPVAPASAGAAARADPGAMSDRVKRSQGKTGQGRSADASASSKASQARGVPSRMSQTSKGRAKPPVESKPKPAKPTEPAAGEPKKKNEQNSGSTAGQGSSKGSSKNPAATDWSSKDQVNSPEDTEIEDDEQTEDEEEEQESRGGVQPALRDRRPPVSRDLRIGFGNRPNPDANGRGGPSAPKKSRGVASLVLGVPIPDRIKGQPNPGKTKITQERIEPRAEEVSTVDAQGRGARQGPLGRLGRPGMNPWMRELVRGYFAARR